MNKAQISNQYVIVFLLKSNIKKYHNSLSDKLAKKYKMASVSKTVDPHITLKWLGNSIDQTKLQDIEKLLEKFCKKQQKAKLQLKGIGNFGKKVIFIEIIASNQLKKLYKNLTKEMDKLSWIEWNEFDKKNMHFHATLISKKEDLTEFDSILADAKKAKPDFDLEMDNISIIKKQKNKWILYKSFKLL